MIQVGQKTSFGAKITGAGGGGCIFALTDTSNLNQTINEFQSNNYDCFFSGKLILKDWILFFN